MRFSSAHPKKLVLLGALAASALAAGTIQYAKGSDHAGTTLQVSKPGIDLTDLHIFPGGDANNVVLSMTVRPLIAPGTTAAQVSFDTDVLYQFKIDTTGDSIEDLVIQAKFEGKGANQRVRIAGPVKPSRIGTKTVFETPGTVVGTFNKVFTTSNNMLAFAGFRGDPFFIDLEQLFAILPDRGTPVFPNIKPPAGQENTPQQTTFRAPGQAKDFLANLNALAIVVEMPRSLLGGGVIRVWETTSIAD